MVDWILLLTGFGVVWYATPPIGWLTILCCALAVLLGAALGTWSLMLEPEENEEG